MKPNIQNKVDYNSELKVMLIICAFVIVVIVTVIFTVVLPYKDHPSVLDDHRIITKDNIPLMFNDSRFMYVVVAPYKDDEYTIFYHVKGNNQEAREYSYSITKDIPDWMKQRIPEMYGSKNEKD